VPLSFAKERPAALKYSIAATAGILVVGTLLGVGRQQTLEKLRAEYRHLHQQAERLGVPLAPSFALHLSRRTRESLESQSRSMATQAIIFAREIDSRRLRGTLSDVDFQKRALEMNQRLVVLSAVELRKVIKGLLAEKDLTSETRVNFIGSLILILSDERPAEAVQLYTESAEFLADAPLARHVISRALRRWAVLDPLAAQSWLRNHPEGHRGISESDAQRLILAGTLKNSPSLAITLLQEMNATDSSNALRTLIEEADTLEQRSAILAALREQKATQSLSMPLATMARNLKGESFETLQTWLNDSGLNPFEKAQFASGLTYASTQQDTGQWIDWMARSLTGAPLRDGVGSLVSQWTQQDYLAAGKWLTALAAGPAKYAAVSTYATTVAKYEPQTAVQWALTLPEGPDRQATLAAIHRNWPKSDAAAAARFALDYGLPIKP
jgi:hypothetical protein